MLYQEKNILMKLTSPSSSSAPQNVTRQELLFRDISESDIAERIPGSFAFISTHAWCSGKNAEAPPCPCGAGSSNITFLGRTLNLVNSVPVRVPEVDPTPATLGRFSFAK